MADQPKWVWQHPSWPKWTWDQAALANALGNARRAQGQVLGRAQLLNPSLDAAAETEVLAVEGLNTSAIEGEQIDFQQLRSSIARRLGVPLGDSVVAPAPRAVEGLVDVLLDATREHTKPLTAKRLFAWQAALFPTGRSGLYEIRVGQLRGPEPMRIVSGPHERERVHYEAPPREGLEAELQSFVDWFNHPPQELDGLLRAGLAHLWFEVIHPFDDGNGRVGRALLDMALAQDEQRSARVYSLSSQLNRNRNEYYAALERASRGSPDATSWLLFFLSQLEAAANASESVIAKVLDKARFWMAHGAQPLNDRQRKVINRLLDAGRGGFEGGLTNAKYRALTRAPPSSAQRDLADLVKRGFLETVGSGRGVRYEINWDERAM